MATILVPTIYTLKSKFYIQVSDGTWKEQTQGVVEMILRTRGFSAKAVDKILTAAVTDNHVAYAGSLAGYSTGLYTIAGRRILVTDSPALIQPEFGKWPLLDTVFERIYTDGWNDDQRPYLFGWLQVALRTLYAPGGFNGRHRPGQILAIVGPASSGKSLTQHLITKMFGGRIARPWAYMAGKTHHNGDLFHAEHLMIEDDVIKRSKREEFGKMVNSFTVNDKQRCRSLYQEAETLTPFWRITMTLNPANLPIIPMMDNDLKIKFMLMMATLREMPMPTGTLEERAAFEDKLVAELPHFIHYLLKEFEIPREIQDQRFGVRYWHHPDLLRDLASIDAGITFSYARQLLQVVREAGQFGISRNMLSSYTPEGCAPETFNKIIDLWKKQPGVLVTDDHVTWVGKEEGGEDGKTGKTLQKPTSPQDDTPDWE